MSARTDLARLLGKHYGTSAGGDDYLWAMADIVLELLHPVITTAEDLDALPVGTVVLDAYGATCTNIHGRRILGWRRVTLAVEDGVGHWRAPYLPATVLHVGGEA
jgi:hypothetical protein